MRSHLNTIDLTTEIATAGQIERRKSFYSCLILQKNHYSIGYSGTCDVVNLEILFQFTSLSRQFKFFMASDNQICVLLCHDTKKVGRRH